CINTAITDITYATTGATGATVTGLPAGVTGTWLANVVTITGTPTASGSFPYTVTLTGGCGVITSTGTITVNPDNTSTLSSAAGTDNQTVCINTAITDITYATTGATGATVTGLPAGVTGTWLANVVTITGTPTATGSFPYTVTLTGGCNTITSTGTITVGSPDAITLTSAAGTDNQSVCVNTAMTDITYSTTGATGATFTGLPAGITGTWLANVVTITGTPTSNGTFSYTVTLTGGCGGSTANGTITVLSNNTVILSSAAGTDSQTACINTAITDITYTTAGATGATVSGLPAGVTGTWAANVVTITGTPSASGTFSYTVTTTGGCGVATANGTITVSADNTSVLSSASGTDNQSICITNAITDITYATTGATGATVTGLPAGVTGTWAANVVTITGTPTASGSFPYTVTLSGGCGTVTSTGTITVDVVPSVVITNPAAVCSPTTVDLTRAAITAGSTPGLTFTYWTDAAATVAYATPAAAGSGTYYIKGTTAGGCFDIQPVTVTVNTSPAGTTAVTNVLCNGAANGSVDLTVTGGAAPYTFLWSNSATTEDISGLTAGTYSVTITDNTGCTTLVSADVTQPAQLSIAETHVDAKCPGETNGSITLTITGGTTPYSILWSDGLTTGTRDAKDTTYSVVVLDANSCAANLDITVGISDGSNCIQVPEVITPNGDGKNDVWVIKNIDMYPNAEVLVFSRWGKCVFRTKNISANPWDGKYHGKYVPVDSYHYILYLNDGSKPRTGVITVIR
ncbi:MAG TPA: gliding motility-associated C-terminal domain-containing protein, partial [Bacteroidales bacterium]|nr:gliding motility-associated C-terminal domain-containing protein [Bacteroidales bacterium]